jgi:hypothetical protein
MYQEHGIDVYDPTGDWIGWSYSDGFVTRNWVPISGNKESACGRFDHYDYYVYTGFWSNFVGEDHDANLTIQPQNSTMAAITENPINWGISDRSEMVKCDSYSSYFHCFESEIDLGDTYANNPWFPLVEDSTSTLTGKDICVYGPWVADHGHGARPEIHPAEGIWWETSPRPSGVVWEKRVLLAHDNSDRYDDRGDFDPTLPSSIEPWADVPAREFVRVAYQFPFAYSGPSRSPISAHAGPRFRCMSVQHSG